MEVAEVLRDILVVLIFAKAAAELAERVGVPAVVGEIVAGILIGPSLLGFVGGGDEVLRTLGEIGVILLLLDVGMEMDLRELGKVGRASLLVATVGVIAPMLLGIGAMELLGFEFKTALFVGAALTATSVGITARVFGDLRALATTEARIVLGAAVADDVMGLVVLTVVVRLVTEGSVSIVSVAGIIGVAVAFLVFGGFAGLKAAPPLFGLVEKVSRSTGTLVAVALAFTLAFAQVAEAAKLAPIVGAFVAGIALSQSRQHERIRRELAPVGHLFIPVFFLQIGIDAEISAFGRVTVLRDAAILLVVAIIGKLVSPIGAIGSPGDKPLIGLGMLPRGEVGLIFATLGLQAGVLGEDLYAALLLVVLLTTLIAPQLLKLRYSQMRAADRRVPVTAETTPPAGGWLVVEDGEVHLRATPPDSVMGAVAFQAAILVGRHRPGDDLLDRMAELPDAVLPFDEPTVGLLLDVIERGNARSWRFLETSGALDRLLPELADAFRHRQRGSFELDPLAVHRLRSMERLRVLDADDPLAHEIRSLRNLDHLLLGALLASALDEELDPVGTARRAVRRLGLPAEDEADVVGLVADRDLLWSAAGQAGGLGEEAVLQLASHLETPERARALYALSALAGDGRERWERNRLRELHDLVQSVLADTELMGTDATSLTERHRAEAAAHVDGAAARARVERAPRAYVLRQAPEVVARHAALLDPLPADRTARVSVTEAGPGRWAIDVVSRDTPGLLAAITGALSEAGVDVDDAVLAQWDDGATLTAFNGRADAKPRVGDLGASIEEALRSGRLASEGAPDAVVAFDRHASPWHTVCEVTAPDRPGLLHQVATAFAAAGVEVVAARITQADGMAVDRFEVTDRDGGKVDAETEATATALLAGGVTAKRRRFGRSFAVRPG